MADKTANYGLTKPLPSEFYDVTVQNGNMDAIDAALHGLETGKETPEGAQEKADQAKAEAISACRPAEWIPNSEEIGPAIEEVIDGQKGKANGLASLGSTGTIPTSQIPTLPSTKLPTVPVSKGGTGKTSWLSSRMIYALSSTSLTQLAFPSVAGSILRQGRSGAPYWTPPEDMCDAIGAVPDTRTINGKPLSEDTTLTAADVDALPSSGGTLNGNLTVSGTEMYPKLDLISSDSSETRIGAVEHSVVGKNVYLCNRSSDRTKWSQLVLYPEDSELRRLLRLAVQTDDWAEYFLYGTHNVKVVDSTPAEFVGEDVIVFCTSNHSIYRGIDGANVRFY